MSLVADELTMRDGAAKAQAGGQASSSSDSTTATAAIPTRAATARSGAQLEVSLQQYFAHFIQPRAFEVFERCVLPKLIDQLKRAFPLSEEEYSAQRLFEQDERHDKQRLDKLQAELDDAQADARHFEARYNEQDQHQAISRSEKAATGARLAEQRKNCQKIERQLAEASKEVEQLQKERRRSFHQPRWVREVWAALDHKTADEEWQVTAHACSWDFYTIAAVVAYHWDGALRRITATESSSSSSLSSSTSAVGAQCDPDPGTWTSKSESTAPECPDKNHFDNYTLKAQLDVFAFRRSRARSFGLVQRPPEEEVLSRITAMHALMRLFDAPVVDIRSVHSLVSTARQLLSAASFFAPAGPTSRQIQMPALPAGYLADANPRQRPGHISVVLTDVQAETFVLAMAVAEFWPALRECVGPFTVMDRGTVVSVFAAKRHWTSDHKTKLKLLRPILRQICAAHTLLSRGKPLALDDGTLDNIQRVIEDLRDSPTGHRSPKLPPFDLYKKWLADIRDAGDEQSHIFANLSLTQLRVPVPNPAAFLGYDQQSLADANVSAGEYLLDIAVDAFHGEGSRLEVFGPAGTGKDTLVAQALRSGRPWLEQQAFTAWLVGSGRSSRTQKSEADQHEDRVPQSDVLQQLTRRFRTTIPASAWQDLMQLNTCEPRMGEKTCNPFHDAVRSWLLANSAWTVVVEDATAEDIEKLEQLVPLTASAGRVVVTTRSESPLLPSDGLGVKRLNLLGLGPYVITKLLTDALVSRVVIDKQLVLREREQELKDAWSRLEALQPATRDFEAFTSDDGTPETLVATVERHKRIARALHQCEMAVGPVPEKEPDAERRIERMMILSDREARLRNFFEQKQPGPKEPQFLPPIDEDEGPAARELRLSNMQRALKRHYSKTIPHAAAISADEVLKAREKELRRLYNTARLPIEFPPASGESPKDARDRHRKLAETLHRHNFSSGGREREDDAHHRIKTSLQKRAASVDTLVTTLVCPKRENQLTYCNPAAVLLLMQVFRSRQQGERDANEFEAFLNEDRRGTSLSGTDGTVAVSIERMVRWGERHSSPTEEWGPGNSVLDAMCLLTAVSILHESGTPRALFRCTPSDVEAVCTQLNIHSGASAGVSTLIRRAADIFAVESRFKSAKALLHKFGFLLHEPIPNQASVGVVDPSVQRVVRDILLREPTAFVSRTLCEAMAGFSQFLGPLLLRKYRPSVKSRDVLRSFAPCINRWASTDEAEATSAVGLVLKRQKLMFAVESVLGLAKSWWTRSRTSPSNEHVLLGNVPLDESKDDDGEPSSWAQFEEGLHNMLQLATDPLLARATLEESGCTPESKKSDALHMDAAEERPVEIEVEPHSPVEETEIDQTVEERPLTPESPVPVRDQSSNLVSKNCRIVLSNLVRHCEAQELVFADVLQFPFETSTGQALSSTDAMRYVLLNTALRRDQQLLRESWEELQCEVLEDPNNCDVDECAEKCIVDSNEYLTMTKTCHGFQFVACHDLKRGKYKEALQSFWRALQERIFKDSVYFFGGPDFGKQDTADVVEDSSQQATEENRKQHAKFIRTIWHIVRYLAAYIAETHAISEGRRDEFSQKVQVNLQWAERAAVGILAKESVRKYKDPVPKAGDLDRKLETEKRAAAFESAMRDARFRDVPTLTMDDFGADDKASTKIPTRVDGMKEEPTVDESEEDSLDATQHHESGVDAGIRPTHAPEATRQFAESKLPSHAWPQPFARLARGPQPAAADQQATPNFGDAVPGGVERHVTYRMQEAADAQSRAVINLLSNAGPEGIPGEQFGVKYRMRYGVGFNKANGRLTDVLKLIDGVVVEKVHPDQPQVRVVLSQRRSPPSFLRRVEEPNYFVGRGGYGGFVDHSRERGGGGGGGASEHFPPFAPAHVGGPPTSRKVPGYKTRLCIHFTKNGRCARGADCNFAHSTAEMEYYRRMPLPTPMMPRI